MPESCARLEVPPAEVKSYTSAPLLTTPPVKPPEAASAPPLPTCSVPALMVVVPVAVGFCAMISVPVPFLTRVPAPERFPRVALPPAAL